MTFKVKIRVPQDITWGPINPDELTAMIAAQDLMRQGYRRTSNAYSTVSRIDRDDWLTVLAKERHCSLADFYNLNGTGVSDSHRDYYVRTHSKDTLTVHPLVVRKVKSYW